MTERDIVERLKDVLSVFEDETDLLTNVDVPLGLVRDAIDEIERLRAALTSRPQGSRTEPNLKQLNIRIPDWLKMQLTEAARLNGRSLNTEIVKRLAASLAAESGRAKGLEFSRGIQT